MTRFEKWSLSALLWATTCWSCAVAPRIPMVPRPDTRNIWGVTVDSLAVAQTLEMFRAAMPKEASVCYRGAIRDTLYVGSDSVVRRALLLHLTSAYASRADSADLYHVWYSVGNAGCDETAIASGHSHPHVGLVCDHSDNDVNVLFENPRLLASLVWCLNGWVQIYWQDGRRNARRWASG